MNTDMIGFVEIPDKLWEELFNSYSQRYPYIYYSMIAKTRQVHSRISQMRGWGKYQVKDIIVTGRHLDHSNEIEHHAHVKKVLLIAWRRH